MKTIAELKQEFENITLFKLFEIEVINKETKDKDIKLKKVNNEINQIEKKEKKCLGL